MKKIITIIIVSAATLAQTAEIKSLLVYTSSPKILPVIIDSERLTIEFDIAAFSEPNLIIQFRFCDSKWVPYYNTFLLNQGYNTAYNLYFDQVPVESGNVRYHYKDQFPNYDVTFPFSGKWKFFIADGNNPDEVLAEGRFYVVRNGIPVNLELDKYRLSNSQERTIELQRTLELRASFNLPDTLYPMDLDYVEVIENLKVDYPINIIQDNYGDLRFFETNGRRGFTFIAKDIKPGNEYRQVDLRDRNKYQPPITQAHYDGFDYNRFEKMGRRDFNGGLKLVDFTDPYADYMEVEFEYSPLNYISDDIYLVGSFTNWEVLPEFKLEDSGGLYKLSTELKRGVYDYQYVTGYGHGQEVENLDWYSLEGNFLETTNYYHVFIYYKSQDLGGYDQIIGYSRIESGR